MAAFRITKNWCLPPPTKLKIRKAGNHPTLFSNQLNYGLSPLWPVEAHQHIFFQSVKATNPREFCRWPFWDGDWRGDSCDPNSKVQLVTSNPSIKRSRWLNHLVYTHHGRNPKQPPGMYESLKIIGYLPYQLVFSPDLCPSTVSLIIQPPKEFTRDLLVFLPWKVVSTLQHQKCLVMHPICMS